MANYRCPNCQHAFSVPDWLDTRIRCPKCAATAQKQGATEAPPSRAHPSNEPRQLPAHPQAEADVPYSPFLGTDAIRAAPKDRHGNPQGSQYDLARDGAFEGLQIAVLHLYTGGGFDFHLPQASLAEKGFSVHRWADSPPDARELARVLELSCQLWLVSDATQKLSAQHLAVIRSFFEAGKGVYIWGDNDPYHADANFVAGALFGGHMSGCVQGERTVQCQTVGNRAGFIQEHLICRGLELLYEGHTIATVADNPLLHPVVYGSAGNLVVAAYDQGGRRALFDGGFTRLYLMWDTAGTGRYVKNAASWLANYERFGPALFGR